MWTGFRSQFLAAYTRFTAATNTTTTKYCNTTATFQSVRSLLSLTRCVRCIYVVSVGAELPEGLDEEPGAFVPRPVQSDPHGVLLQQSGETLVHRQVFITLHVEQLQTENVLSYLYIYSVPHIITQTISDITL